MILAVWVACLFLSIFLVQCVSQCAILPKAAPKDHPAIQRVKMLCWESFTMGNSHPGKPHNLPSGKHTKTMERSTLFKWVNQLFQ